MSNNYTVLAVFEYSTEAHLMISKLDSENIRSMLMDEKTIDSDPLISQAIGGVKLLVHDDDFENAVTIYNDIRAYQKHKNGDDIHCGSCNSTRILTAPPQRKNIFYMLFPFFEKTKNICNDCKTVF